jgi:hypothetical protein
MMSWKLFIAVAATTLFTSSVGAQTAMPRPPAGAMQDPQAMLAAYEAAQAEASRPGDEKLTCEKLQEQLVAIVQDPALTAHVQAAGVTAEKDLAKTEAAKGRVAAQTAATIIASAVPGASMGVMAAQAADAQAKQPQYAERMQSKMIQAQQMMTLMPKLMRGQRLLELAAGRRCEWAADLNVGATPGPAPSK